MNPVMVIGGVLPDPEELLELKTPAAHRPTKTTTRTTTTAITTIRVVSDFFGGGGATTGAQAGGVEAAGACGGGLGGGTTEIAAPHLEQNWAPAWFGVPHFWQ